MNFAHGELYMLGAYAGIAVVGATHSFWVALILAPLLVAALGAVTEVATLRPIYRRDLGDGAERGDEEGRSEEHTSELQSQSNLVCRLLLEKKKRRRTRQRTWLSA